MPVTLIVRRKGEPDLAPVSFEGPRIVLGRGASCDVRLPDPSVSGRHASIRAQGASWAVVDEGSTNGTKLNGEKLATHSPRALKTGDVITLGRLEVVVKIGAAPISNAQQTRELALALVARSMGDAGATRAIVAVTEGPDAGAKLELDKTTPRTVGRDPRCALRLTDRAVPPIALEISVEGSRVKVAARDPRAEARLAERRLEPGELVGWGDGVVLRIGATALELHDPLARALDASSHGDDERFVPPPPEPEPEPIAPAAEEEPKKPEEPPKPQPPPYDRRRSWRGATLAFEIVALVLAVLVLGGSIAGLVWLLRK